MSTYCFGYVKYKFQLLQNVSSKLLLLNQERTIYTKKSGINEPLVTCIAEYSHTQTGAFFGENPAYIMIL